MKPHNLIKKGQYREALENELKKFTRVIMRQQEIIKMQEKIIEALKLELESNSKGYEKEYNKKR